MAGKFSYKDFVKNNTDEIEDFYSRYGKVNSVGAAKFYINVNFQNLKNNVKLEDIPKHYYKYNVVVREAEVTRSQKLK